MRPAAAGGGVVVYLTLLAYFLGLLLILLLQVDAACGAGGLPTRKRQPPAADQPQLSPHRHRRREAAEAEAEAEEKVRLGSSPPSCRGKCYDCSPCTAVQVPTLSSVPGPAVATTLSNYKPVGWKCQCGDRLYEP